MYIINITYKVSLTVVDEYLKEHVVYLNEQYKLDNFHASGRKNPRVGGIILSKISDKEKLENIIAKDPFKLNDVANYELIEFIPTKTCNELQFLAEE